MKQLENTKTKVSDIYMNIILFFVRPSALNIDISLDYSTNFKINVLLRLALIELTKLKKHKSIEITVTAP